MIKSLSIGLVCAAFLALPATASAQRPGGTAVGMGAGWDLPTAVDNLNTAGVRLRLISGLTFEPRVELARASTTVDFGAGDAETSTTSLALVTTVRVPLASSGPLDFIILGGGGASYSSTDPEGDDNAESDTVFFLLWGLSVEYWIGPRWCFSMTATNPFLSLSKSKEEMPGDDASTSTTAIGIIFDPDIVAMFHLFY